MSAARDGLSGIATLRSRHQLFNQPFQFTSGRVTGHNLVVADLGFAQRLFLYCVTCGCGALVVAVTLVFKRMAHLSRGIHEGEIHSFAVDAAIGSFVFAGEKLTEGRRFQWIDAKRRALCKLVIFWLSCASDCQNRVLDMRFQGAFSFTVAFWLSAMPAFANPLAVDDIIALSNAQIGDEAIIAKIRSSGTQLDLSPQEMIDLRKRGVSSNVIAMLIGNPNSVTSSQYSMNSPDPQIPHPTGLYALVGSGPGARMIKIDPTNTSQVKTTGMIGYALTGGIASLGMRVSVPNRSARVRASGRPTFYFFFDDSRSGAMGGTFIGNAFNASSPNEFSLVRLEPKDGRREARVGRFNIGGMKLGVMDKDRIQFRYDAVRPGVFMVTTTETLKPGEYGFLYSLPGGGMGGAMTARIFDFGVELSEVAPPNVPVDSHSVANAAQTSSLPIQSQSIRRRPRQNARVRCDTCN